MAMTFDQRQNIGERDPNEINMMASMLPGKLSPGAIQQFFTQQAPQFAQSIVGGRMAPGVDAVTTSSVLQQIMQLLASNGAGAVNPQELLALLSGGARAGEDPRIAAMQKMRQAQPLGRSPAPDPLANMDPGLTPVPPGTDPLAHQMIQDDPMFGFENQLPPGSMRGKTSENYLDQMQNQPSQDMDQMGVNPNDPDEIGMPPPDAPRAMWQRYYERLDREERERDALNR